MRRWVTALAVAAVGLGGCSFLIQEKETGRPCKPATESRRCPVGQVCNGQGLCEIGSVDGGVAECGIASPDDVSDCDCPGSGAVLCSATQQCLCFTLVGTLNGIGAMSQSGFAIDKATLGTRECVTQGEFNLCGGLKQ